MRKLALLIIPVLALVFAPAANAAKPTKALQQAAQRSFNGLKGKSPKGTYDGVRLQVNQSGKKGSAALEKFGRAPGPMVIGYKPSTWYAYKTASFAQKDGKWAKQGKWNTLMFALNK